MILIIIATAVRPALSESGNPVLVRDGMGYNFYYAYMPCGTGETNDMWMQVLSRFGSTQHNTGLFVQRMAFAGVVRHGKWQNTVSGGRVRTLGAGTTTYPYNGWKIRIIPGPYDTNKIISWNIPDGHNLIILRLWGSTNGGQLRVKLGTTDNDIRLDSELCTSTINCYKTSSRIYDVIVAQTSTSTGRVLTVCPDTAGAGAGSGVVGLWSYDTNAIGDPNTIWDSTSGGDNLAMGHNIPILMTDSPGNYYGGSSSVVGFSAISGLSYVLYLDTDVEGNMSWCNPGGTAKWCTPLAGGHLDDGEDAVARSDYKTASSASTTYTTTSCTDSSGWDLSAATPFDYACTSQGHVGRINSINGPAGFVGVISWSPATPDNGTVCNIVPAKNMTHVIYGSNYEYAYLNKKCMAYTDNSYGIKLGSVIDTYTISLVDNVYFDYADTCDSASATNLVSASISRTYSRSGYTWSIVYKFSGPTDISSTTFLGNFSFVQCPIGRVGKVSFPPDTTEYEILGTQGTDPDFIVYGVNNFLIRFYDIPYEIEFRPSVPLFMVYSQELGNYAKLYSNAYKSLLHYNSLGSETSYGMVSGDSFSMGGNIIVRSKADCANRPAADLNGDCKVDFYDMAILGSQWLDCGYGNANDCLP